MNRLLRRIEKVEKRVQLIEEEAYEKKAKLSELQKLRNDDSMPVLLAKAELQRGYKLSIFDILVLAGIQQPEDSC